MTNIFNASSKYVLFPKIKNVRCFNAESLQTQYICLYYFVTWGNDAQRPQTAAFWTMIPDDAFFELDEVKWRNDERKP